MSEFSSQLMRRPTAPAPPPDMAQGGAGGEAPPEQPQSPLAQALAQTNAMLAQAIQSGDLPPDVGPQIEQMAQLFMELAQVSGGRGPEAQGMQEQPYEQQ